MSISNSKKRVYREFYEKTGIQLTDEPLPASNPEIKDELEELYHLAQNRPRKALPKLEKLVEAYPKIPSIKNYLQLCYAQTNQLKKAQAIQDRTIKEHPNYVFGIFNTIMNLHTKEELEQQAHLLGEPRHIHTLTGERLIHSSEYINYQHAAAHFEALTGDTDSAVKRLDTLIELKISAKSIKDCAKKIAIGRFMEMNKNISKMQEGRIVVESFPKVDFTPTVSPPSLKLEELDIFYEEDVDNLDVSIIAEILQLPKEDLIVDFEAMIDDGIQRYDILKDLGFNQDTYDFVIHAMYFLGALKSESSLEKVLNLLRMGSEFMDFWFGDMREDFFHPVLFSLGEQQLDKLKSFVLEENIDGFNRLLATHAVAQIALHQPHRRSEVINWFKEVYTYHLDCPNNTGLIDTDFLAMSVGYVIDFRGKELIPIITKMYENKWIPDNIEGNLEEIIKEINNPPHPSELVPIPQNITEYYTKEYRSRKAERPPISEEERIKMEHSIYGETPAEKMVTEYTLEMMTSMISGKKPSKYLEEDEDDFFFDDDYDDYEYVQPVKQIVRTAPKVGRNDPCPCGSGKKYKKCCLRK